MIAPLKIQPKPDLDARLAFAACALDGHCFIGWRHDLILRDDIKPRGLYMKQECQGFVDDRGCFWSREVSAQIAYRARQIARPAEVIMSEELWDPDGTPRDGWKPDESRVATPAPTTDDDRTALRDIIEEGSEQRLPYDEIARFICDLGFHQATPPAAPVAVTDAMVHAALRAFYPYTNPAISSGTPDIDRMRAALAAAASAAHGGKA